MSTRTRRSAPTGDQHATTTTSINHNEFTPQAGPVDTQTQTPQRRRRLDVDPHNIIQAEPNGRLKRRRSPSVPLGHAGETTGEDNHGAGGTGSSVSAEQAQARREKARVKGMGIYDAVMYEQDVDGRFLASEFIGLPNKRQFPDYYTLIKHPMSLGMVGEKLFQTHSAGGSASTGANASVSAASNATNGSAGTAGGLKVKLKLNHPSTAGPTNGAGAPAGAQVQGEVYEGYKDLDEVKRDFDLIWGNAKRYNQKESGIFKDAQKLHKLTNNLYREATSSALEPLHPPSGSVEPASEVKEEELPRPTKKIKLGVSQKLASAGNTDKDKDVHMSEPEPEVDLGRLIKAGIKRIETAQAGSPPRRIADFFMALPSKKDYPDYYLFIKAPISLKEIRNKAEKNKYETLEAWIGDVRIMCENAKFYNEEGSLVHSNAEEVEKLLLDIMQDAYKKLGISPPAEALSAGHRLKFNVKPAEPSPAPVVPGNPIPISAPSPVPDVATPKVQVKAPTPHNEKPRAPVTPRIPSGGVQALSTPSQRPAVVQRSSSGTAAQAPSPAHVARPVASPFPPQTSAPRPGPSVSANMSSPSPRLGLSGLPLQQRNMVQAGTPGQPSQFLPPQPLPTAARPMNGMPPSTPRGSVPMMHPTFPTTPGGSMPTTPGLPQRQSLPGTTMSAPPPRASPAPPLPRPQAPVAPLVRRPLPALPMVESMEFAFDAAGSSGAKQLKTVRLRNHRGVTNHSTSIRQETTRLEIVAHLGKSAATVGPTIEGSNMDVDPPAMPATPHFSLKYEGRRISGTSLTPKEAAGQAGGCKWDVPVTSRSVHSTIEITVDKPVDKGQVGKPRRRETYLIFVGRQS